MATANKILNQPSNGSNVGTWDQPNNNNFGFIDSCFGGVANLTLSSQTITAAPTGAVPSPIQSLIWNVPNGTISANVVYTIPGGYGGQWIVNNQYAGSYTISFQVGSSTVTIPSGTVRTIYSDGSSIQFSDNQTTTAGSPNQIIYNSGGSLTGSAGLTFDGTGTLSTNSLNINSNAASVSSAGAIAGSSISTTGNATVGGTLNTTGAVTTSTTINAGGAVTAAGIVKSTAGGFMFPDNSTQGTAAIGIANVSPGAVGTYAWLTPGGSAITPGTWSGGTLYYSGIYGDSGTSGNAGVVFTGSSVSGTWVAMCQVNATTKTAGLFYRIS